MPSTPAPANQPVPTGGATTSAPITGEHINQLPGESGFREGLRVAGVLCIGFVVMGMGLGVLVASVGLPWWVAPALSAIVFAGSVEFLLVGMIATSTPLSLIASTTLLMNARHLVYGISYPLQNVKGNLAKALTVYMLCDEAYALNTAPGSQNFRSSRIMTVSVVLWLSWWGGSTLGVILGATFLSHLEGVDFVMTGMFLVLSIDAYRAVKDHITASLAVAASLTAIVLAPHSMLLVSLLTLVALLMIRHAVAQHAATSEKEAPRA
ncbi:AzlC family ABC transporter permease [Rothia nasimurium]|uniref:AzlC family ABC transporter permease n=1 Tax=Rothia nasimurium TaxID=85336 RepID=UPI00142F705A|nr:AzlC family ABC transporter permease [Rothia nasimurium]MBF0809207.1 AzlC family ABC transporter permease [Rothia nasimurium]